MKKHAGYSLIEMSVAMIMLSAVMTLAAGLIHGLMGASRAVHGGLDQQASLARLAETFRADVHAAVAFRSVPAADAPRPSQWELKQADGAMILYQIEDNSLICSTRNAAGSMRQSFGLPAGAAVAIETHRQGEATLVTLTLTPGPTAVGAPQTPAAGLCVEAHLARDRRLAEVPIRPAQPEATPESQEEPFDE